MQMVKNSLIVALLLPIFLIIFMPKQELYYELERQLQPYNITITGESVEESLLGLNIAHPTIYFNGAVIAKADSIRVWTLLAYTTIDITNLDVADGMPIHIGISNANLTHSLLSPTTVEIVASSSIGGIDGSVDILDRNIHLNIDNNGSKGIFKQYLKKGKEGWQYESRF